jgi:hypothetical protein
MKTYLDNLRPFEKRVVVGGLALFFIVFNFVFVWPHFSDLKAVNWRMEQAQNKLTTYQKEVADTGKYTVLVKKLEGEGLTVPPEDQIHNFRDNVQMQAAQSHVGIVGSSRVTSSTTQFFIEQSESIQIQAGEPQLVEFLYNLGAGNSLIRVRDLSLGPDPPHHELVGSVKLVASYQKKAAGKPATPSAPRSTVAKQP